MADESNFPKTPEQLLKEDIERRERAGFQGAQEYGQKEEELLESAERDLNNPSIIGRENPNRTLGVKVAQSFGMRTSPRMQILREPLLLVIVAVVVFILIARHHGFLQALETMFFQYPRF